MFSELYKLSCNSDKIEVHFIQIATTQGKRKNLNKADLSIHQYPYKLLFSESYEEITFKRKLLALQKEVNNLPVDTIIIPGYNDPVFWLLIPFWKSIGKQLIICSDSTFYDFKRVWYKELFKSFLFKFSDLVFCYGTMQTEYLKTLKVRQEKIHIRCQATDNEKIRKVFLKNRTQRNSTKTRYFLYVGRLSKEKNINTLIKAFGRCKGNWKLLIVGRGEEEDNLKRLVNQSKIQKIEFLGRFPWDKVAEIYAKSNVFVLPSISEPWGLVVNEAMLCEMPVVVSSHCGCSKNLVQGGKNGFIFDPYDVEKLREIMQSIIDEEYDLEKMGANSFKIIQSYSPENASQQMLAGILKLK